MRKYSFQEAQKLYEFYSPLKNNNELMDLFFSVTYYPFDKTIENNPSLIRRLINDVIYECYPNEAIIKSAFLNKYLFNCSPNDIVSFEVPVGRSRLDLCKIGKDSSAYEIKTDLDTTCRLNKQIEDYKRVFDYTYIICSKKMMDKIIADIDDNVGLFVYSKNKQYGYVFHKTRPAIKNTELDSESQLAMLSKNEFKNFCKETAVSSIEASNIVAELDPNTINTIFKRLLMNRYRQQWGFMQEHKKSIYDIDYQFFFKQNILPETIYCM